MAGTALARRRRLSAGRFAVWRSLMEVTGELHRVVGAELLRDTGLSNADYRVLVALSAAPGKRMRAAQLAAAIDWERSRLSHHLARMQERDLVGRDGCATDSRGTEVYLTAEGADRFRRATTPHARTIKRYFADALTPQQLDALDDILDTLREHLK